MLHIILPKNYYIFHHIYTASISEKTLSLYDSQAQLGCESEELTPFLVLKHHFSEILDLVPDPDRLANDMSTVDLITNVVRDDVLTTTGLSRYGKASKLLNEAQKSLKFNNNPETLILLCKVLNNQRSPLITTICNNMLKKFGKLLNHLSCIHSFVPPLYKISESSVSLSM